MLDFFKKIIASQKTTIAKKQVNNLADTDMVVSSGAKDAAASSVSDVDMQDMSGHVCVSRMTAALRVSAAGKKVSKVDEATQAMVERLVDTEMIGAGELVELVHAAFSNYALARIIDGEGEPPADLESLACCIINQPKVMSVLDAAQEATKPVVASAVFAGLGANGCLNRGIACEVLSAGFEMLAEIDSDKSFSNRMAHWNGIFMASISFSDRVPDSLIAFAVQNPRQSKAVTSRVSKVNHASRSWEWANFEDLDRASKFCVFVLESIVKADPEDYVAFIALGNVYLDANRHVEARGCFRKAAAIQAQLGFGHKDLCDAKLAIARTYASQVKFMKKSHNCTREEVRFVMVEAREGYASLIDSAVAHGIDCDAYYQHYVRFLKNNGLFRDAEEIVQQMAPGWRRSLEEGMLYSSINARRPDDVARFTDFPHAIACFVDAWHKLDKSESRQSSKAKASVLYPLANALFNSGDEQSALEVAKYGLATLGEKRFLGIIKKAGNGVCLPDCGATKMPALLERA